MIPSEALAFLREHGAARTAHSGATLWHHLHGVHAILQACGAARAVCLAGLFHSVYGTQVFKQAIATPRERDAVRACIGVAAEEMVWAFAVLPRPRLFEDALARGEHGWSRVLAGALPLAELESALLHIECANLLEQKALFRFPALLAYARNARMLDGEGFPVRCGASNEAFSNANGDRHGTSEQGHDPLLGLSRTDPAGAAAGGRR